MTSASFVVPGAPVPKERPRFFRGHAFTPPRTRQYEKLVRERAVLAGLQKWDGQVHISMFFYLPDARRRDGGNMAKAIEDALNGVAYGDDSQIVSCVWCIAIDRENPRAEVRLVGHG